MRAARFVRSVTAPYALVAAVLAGCESNRQPTAPTDGPDLARTRITQENAQRYLVAFTGSAVPAGFAARVAALGGKIDILSAPLGFAAVRGLKSTSVAALAREPGVASVDPEPVSRLQPPAKPQFRKPASARPGSAADPATALIFAGLQWGLRAIKADAAWAAGRLGSPGTRAAILDTGIDYTHPDLAGLVDLANSVDFVGEADSIAKYFGPGFEPFADLNGHGTLVASIVSSQAILAAGVTSRTRLIAVKVCEFRGSCSFGSIFQGLQHAADLGAQVANMSIEGALLKNAAPGIVSIINRALNYTYRKGTLVVVAAGNSAIDLDHAGNLYSVFCDAPNVVCVAATGPTGEGALGPFVNVDAVAFYTDFGRSAISLAAPGGNGVFDSQGNLLDITPVWGPCSATTLTFANFPPAPDEPPIDKPCTGDPLGVILGGIGTSFASPHVAGVAALIADQNRSPSALRARLQQTADDLGKTGTDPFYGKGRVNAARAAGL